MKTKQLLATLVCSSTLSLWAQLPHQFLPDNKLLSLTSSSVVVLDSLIAYNNWNATQNKWDDGTKWTYRYNTYGKENGYFVYLLGGNGWQNILRSTNYQFDNRQNCIEKMGEEFGIQGWALASKSVYTYDAADHELNQLQLDYVAGNWENNSNSIYTYAGNNQATSTEQLWNTSTQSWKNWFKYNYSYNTNDQLISSTGENWKAGSWVYLWQTTNYVYNGTDLMSYEFQQWDTISASFKTNIKTTISYDVNHHPQNHLEMKWNASTATWENYRSLYYTFDANDNISSLLTKKWLPASNSWANDHETVYYYRNTFTGFEDTKNSSHPLKVSPNPATTFIEINGGKGPAMVNVTDLSGKTIIRERMEAANAARVDIGSLAPGLYLLDVTTEKEHFNGKFLKQ